MEIQICVTKIGCKISWISVSQMALQEQVYRKQMQI